MRTLIIFLSFVIFLCLSMPGQSVDSGSTGADGSFNPPSPPMPAGTDVQGNCGAPPGCTVTVQLREPPNHAFHFTTVTIGQFVTVKFRRNAANTPAILLAQGNVTINGTIDLSGQSVLARSYTGAQGGPGGSSGGLGAIPGSPTIIGGAGNGIGGGWGGRSAPMWPGAHGEGGAFGENGFVTRMYGIPELQPLIGGSGGGAGTSGSVPGGNGGGGGGALLIASSTLIDVGSGSGIAIVVNGGAGEDIFGVTGGGGSGGAIRLVATRLIGNRSLVAVGGAAGFSPGKRGRIRLDSARAPEYTGGTDPIATFNEPGQPIPVFPATVPSLRIVSIAGTPLPAQPTFEASTPDITLPTNFANPVSVVLEATNVPSGTPARVIVAPQYGSGIRILTPSVALTGPAGQPKRATVSVDLPARGAGVISAVIDSVVSGP